MLKKIVWGEDAFEFLPYTVSKKYETNVPVVGVYQKFPDKTSPLFCFMCDLSASCVTRNGVGKHSTGQFLVSEKFLVTKNRHRCSEATEWVSILSGQTVQFLVFAEKFLVTKKRHRSSEATKMWARGSMCMSSYSRAKWWRMLNFVWRMLISAVCTCTIESDYSAQGVRYCTVIHSRDYRHSYSVGREYRTASNLPMRRNTAPHWGRYFKLKLHINSFFSLSEKEKIASSSHPSKRR